MMRDCPQKDPPSARVSTSMVSATRSKDKSAEQRCQPAPLLQQMKSMYDDHVDVKTFTAESDDKTISGAVGPLYYAVTGSTVRALR